MNKQQPRPASESPQYRKFISERDKALEIILNHYLSSSVDVTRFLVDQILDITAGIHARSKQQSHFAVFNQRPQYEAKLDLVFRMAANSAYELAKNLRLSTYTLAHAGEAEALSRALGKPLKAKVDQESLSRALNKQAMYGGSLKERIEYTFNKLKRDILNALELSMVQNSSLDEMIARVKRALPKPYKIKRPLRALKPVKIKEADYKLGKGNGLSIGIVDDAAWNKLLDDYQEDVIDPSSPFGRSDFDIYKVEQDYAVEGESAIETRYGWELEQELTDDFVSNVRDGQIDAAKENGIEDFQWIAIIDSKTDDCCAWRDGLTTTEIEEQLNSDHKDDECDVSTPPAHANCRCTLAPMVKDMPESPMPDFGGFDEWLTS